MTVGGNDEVETGKKRVIKVRSVSNLNAYDKALLKFAENQLVGSVETIKTFSQTMITLVSGLFAIYFALLSFLGIESTLNASTLFVKSIIGVPPLLFILSILAFVVAIIPWIMKISYTKLEDIEDMKETVISVKYAAIIVGVALFIISLAITIVIFNTLLLY